MFTNLYVLEAVAKGRHEDLLEDARRERLARVAQEAARRERRGARARRPLRRLAHGVGVLLVEAGSRLMAATRDVAIPPAPLPEARTAGHRFPRRHGASRATCRPLPLGYRFAEK